MFFLFIFFYISIVNISPKMFHDCKSSNHTFTFFDLKTLMPHSKPIFLFLNTEIYFNPAQCPAVMFEALLALATHTSACQQ